MSEANPSDSLVAIVTAAGEGIGEATAHAFADAGYRLVLVDINEQAVNETASDLPGSVVEVADVTDEAAVAALVARSLEQFGRVDVLVNVVGGSRPGKTAAELTLDEWNRMLALNLTSTFLMCRAVLPHMEQRGKGAIVNVSSGATKLGSPHEYIDYAATKGALDTMTIGLSREVAAEGIRVNAVRAGHVYTTLHASGGEPDRVERVKSQVPMGRGGAPEEIARAILWLLSDEASYTTGAFLDVAGGK